MLIRSLASNYLKSILRSRFGKLNLAVKILAIVFLWMPFYLYAIAAGLFIDLAFNELAFNVDMPAIASRVVLYFLVFWSGLDILLRTRISLPLFPYLTTPITRRKLALFYQAISAFGKINLLPLLFVLAFWLKNFLLKDVAFGWAWLLLFLSLSACFHLVANQLRTSLGRRYLPMLCTQLFVVALVAMEWRYDIPTLSALSTALFEATLGGAVWPLAIVLVAGAAVLYASTSQIIRGLYVDDTVLSRPRKKVAVKGVDRSFKAGMLSFEWKLIRRNKRMRMMIFSLLYIIFFGAYIIFNSSYYLSGQLSGSVSVFLALTFPIAGCMQFIVSALNFRSVFYDGLASRPVSTDSILSVAFYLTNIMLLVFFSIFAIIFFVMQNFSMLLFSGYMLLYGIGIKYIAPCTWVFEARRFELNGKVFGAVTYQYHKNWWISALYIAPFMFLPLLLIWLLPGIHWGGLTISMLGLAGLLLRSRWVDALTKNLEKKRYVLMEEFRKG